MINRSVILGLAIALLLCTTAVCFAQKGIAPIVTDKGLHLITGNDTVFTDWTDGYIEASGYTAAGEGAKERSLSLARAKMRDQVLNILVMPDITVGAMMQGSSVINQGIEELIYKCWITESKAYAKYYMTTIRLDLFKWTDNYSPLAGTLVKYTQTSGSAAGSGDDEPDGSGSGSGSADMPERMESSDDPGVTAAGGQGEAVQDESAGTKHILTQTEKYFVPMLFPCYYSMNGRMAKSFTDMYPSAAEFIPHYFIADESLQLVLESYNAADLIRAKVNSDRKYKLDSNNESKWYAWKAFKEKAVLFGKYIILYY